MFMTKSTSSAPFSHTDFGFFRFDLGRAGAEGEGDDGAYLASAASQPLGSVLYVGWEDAESAYTVLEHYIASFLDFRQRVGRFDERVVDYPS